MNRSCGVIIPEHDKEHRACKTSPGAKACKACTSAYVWTRAVRGKAYGPGPPKSRFVTCCASSLCHLLTRRFFDPSFTRHPDRTKTVVKVQFFRMTWGR